MIHKWLGLLLSALLLAAILPARGRCDDLPADVRTADLELQVAALTTLDELDVTLVQLKALRTLAKGTAGAGAAEGADAGGDSKSGEPKVSAEYRTALLALRDALASGADDKIDDAQDKVEDLRDSQNIDPDLDYPTTDGARAKARQALTEMSSSQIANYISLHSDEVPDANDTIEDALDQCHDGSEDEFVSLRDEAAEQVGMLAGGMNVTVARQVGQRVSDLLDAARRVSADDFDSKRADFDAKARGITRNIDSFEALHNWMLREMADLLSNPQLSTVLEWRITAANKAAAADKLNP